MGEAKAKFAAEMVGLGISSEVAEALMGQPKPGPAAEIAHIHVLQASRFDNGVHSSFNSQKLKCSFRMNEIGVYVSAERAKTILIPWSNIAWVELK